VIVPCDLVKSNYYYDFETGEKVREFVNSQIETSNELDVTEELKNYVSTGEKKICFAIEYVIAKPKLDIQGYPMIYIH
jgi:hypothetical protein